MNMKKIGMKTGMTNGMIMTTSNIRKKLIKLKKTENLKHPSIKRTKAKRIFYDI